jgi:BirA family biotin operon repressor/biotin-[acetyl-CoA-carboxylase] ligase
LTGPKLPFEITLLAFDTIGSTNDEAKRMAADSADDLTLLWSKEQTTGRGRRERDWVSKPGNLYSTFILRPDKSAQELAQASFISPLAVAEMVLAFDDTADVRFKWPNDVLLNGKKIAGILLEAGPITQNQSDWIVAGCGVNLALHPADTRYPAGSIAEELGQEVEVEAALTTYAEAFLKWYQIWLSAGFDQLKAAWLKRAHGLGDPLQIDTGAEVVAGGFAGLGDTGELLLKVKDDIRSISAGDVRAVGQE